MKADNMSGKIAIIGAAKGQLPLVRKAKELGLYTVCFAWDNGAICKSECDKFYPISIFETDKIVERCKLEGVDGVVTTASEETALAASLIADKLKLNGVKPSVVRTIQNKETVRNLTSSVPGLQIPKIYHDTCNNEEITFPCVIKPIKGSAKKGVCFCEDKGKLQEALEYARSAYDYIIIEEYIPGQEYSVEVLSYHGNHHIIQITRKVTTGFPHFVELEHHQPADLDSGIKKEVEDVVAKILTSAGYDNGASHIEIKINDKGIYLIEINPRAGGDRISDTLIGLSTDCDYLSSIILISLNDYQHKEVHNTNYSGIMYLSAQNNRLIKYFEMPQQDWMVERIKYHDKLTESVSNYDRDGYIIYKSKEKIEL